MTSIQRLAFGFLLSSSFLVDVCMAHAQGPENTLLVVNAESPDSLAIANCYLQLRDIPAVNVVYLRGISSPDGTVPETCNSGQFQTKILRPLLDAMVQRRIESQIDCVAYSADFPTRVNFQPLLETYLENTGGKPSKLLRPYASLTSLTYFHRNAFSKSPDFLELDANHFANPRGMKVLANPFVGEDAASYEAATKNARAGRFGEAIDQLVALARDHREQMPVIYSLARCFAFRGETEKAITALGHARGIGFASRSLLLSDQAFSNMRSLSGFKEIASQLEGLPDGVSPTRSFSGSKYWAKNGWPSGSPDQGERYLLSAMLAVTGKQRSTVEASLGRLSESVLADGTHPQGNVYFADHADVRSKTRRARFPAAVKELEALDRKASIGPSRYPVGDSAVIGVSLGSAKLNWNSSKSSFLPGAICDNLTSHGAWWGTDKQTHVNEWLDAGAAGASGTVCEPYAIAAKFPSARWHAHYARGCTLAESFFQCVAGPFQLLLVGDPLCCPFGDFPEFEIKGIQDGQTVSDDFVLRAELAEGSPSVARFEMYYDGVFLGTVANPDQVAVATDAMSDGYHELRIVGIAKSPLANKSSRKIGFVSDRDGHSVSLDVGDSEYAVGESIRARAVSSVSSEVEILQNWRTIATVKTGEEFTIKSEKLGLGRMQLQASATLPSGITVKSQPVSVSLVSFGGIQKQKKQKTQDKKQRRAVPDKAKLKDATASIRDLLKDSYKDSSPEGRAKLLALFNKTADESAEDPVNHYALLSELVFAASFFGTVDEGWSACDKIESEYEVDDQPRIDFIKKIKANLDEKSARSLYAKGVGLIEKRIEADRFEEAGDLAKSLGATLRQLKSAKAEFAALAGKAKTLDRKFKQIQDDLKVLSEDPANEIANGSVGKFYCLEKNDFEKGLPYLAKGAAGVIRELASDELALEKETPQQRLEIADRWWELGQQKVFREFKKLAFRHYRGAVGELTGLEKIRVEKRIADVSLSVRVSLAKEIVARKVLVTFPDFRFLVSFSPDGSCSGRRVDDGSHHSGSWVEKAFPGGVTVIVVEYQSSSHTYLPNASGGFDVERKRKNITDRGTAEYHLP